MVANLNNFCVENQEMIVKLPYSELSHEPSYNQYSTSYMTLQP